MIFVTGRQEVHRLCAELKRAFPSRELGPGDAKLKRRSRKRSKSTSNEKDAIPSKPAKFSLDDYLIIPEDEESALIGDGGGDNAQDMDVNIDEEEEVDDDLVMGDSAENDDDDQTAGTSFSKPTLPPMHVLPLYSLLSPERQRLVFAPPPEGHRLCVVATNVAETSLTIPGVKYVVDCGKVKVRE